MSERRVPILALTGFLGAGKTTLLNHILEQAGDLKLGVVVNDYGDINIDAEFIEAETDTTLELTGGCICCSLDSMDLDEAICQFAYPGSPIDCVVIEASGLAEPVDLAATLRQALTDQARLDAIVAVLDAANLDPANLPDIVRQQIEHSDIIIINKLDLAASRTVTALRQHITKNNPGARILTATNSQVDVRLLLDPDIAAPLQFDPTDHASHSHLHDHYQSLAFTTDRPLDPEAFQQFINHQLPASIYRGKGIIDFGRQGQNRKYHLQLVGKRIELTWGEWNQQSPQTQLVWIGQDFDRQLLRQQLDACIDANPQTHATNRPIALPRHR